MITIAEEGSMNRAAAKLFLSQPSLTESIRDLEDELGITIFHRSGRGVTLTNDGAEFLQYAREIYSQYETVMEKYTGTGGPKKKFGISTQHYTFAVKAFVDLVSRFDMTKYEFALRETKTREVISDVATLKSEIGIIYLSDFNRRALTKVLRQNSLEFTELITCGASAYISRRHPLAGRAFVTLEDLAPYPNLTFEQGDDSALYYAEELFSASDFSRVIRVNDRGTMLNLIQRVNGYTLCSGIICEDFNGDDCISVPVRDESVETDDMMHIGYIKKKNAILGSIAEHYIDELHKCLGTEEA